MLTSFLSWFIQAHLVLVICNFANMKILKILKSFNYTIAQIIFFFMKIWNILVSSNFGVQSLVKRALALKRPQLLVKFLMITLWKDKLCSFTSSLIPDLLYSKYQIYLLTIWHGLSLSLISTKKSGWYFDARSIQKIRWVGVFAFFFKCYSSFTFWKEILKIAFSDTRCQM